MVMVVVFVRVPSMVERGVLFGETVMHFVVVGVGVIVVVVERRPG